MPTLRRYLTLRFAWSFALFLFGLAALALTLDLTEEADRVLALSDGDVFALLTYSALRLPDVLAQMWPAASLLAALTVFAQMLRSGELVALWGGGVSPLGLIRALLPVGCALAVLSFVIADQLVPYTRAALREWGIPTSKTAGLLGDPQGFVWLTSGDDILRLPRDAISAAPLPRRGPAAAAAAELSIAGTGDSVLGPLSVFRRDSTGVLVEQLDAAMARRDGDGWLLTGVERTTVEPAVTETVSMLRWTGRIDLDALPLLAADNRDLTSTDLRRLIRNKGYSQRPTERYRAWLQGRLAAPLVPILMIALVVSLAQRFRRTGVLAPLLLAGVGIGFAFSAFDGLCLAFGEGGFLPAWFAAWGAKLAMVLLIASFITAREG